MKFRLEVSKTLQQLIKHLSVGLRKLSLVQNFEAFEIDLEWAVSDVEELTAGNPLTFVPTRYIIVSQTGDANITKGDTAWTNSSVYFKNNDTTTAVTVKIIVMR